MVKKSDNSWHMVCKAFYHTVLGYSQHSKLASYTLNNVEPPALSARPDQRGREQVEDPRVPAIRDHIEARGPHQAHYRRERCPNRRCVELSTDTFSDTLEQGSHSSDVTAGICQVTSPSGPFTATSLRVAYRSVTTGIGEPSRR